MKKKQLYLLILYITLSVYALYRCLNSIFFFGYDNELITLILLIVSFVFLSKSTNYISHKIDKKLFVTYTTIVGFVTTIHTAHLWFEYQQYNSLNTEIQLLIACSFLSTVTLFTVYYFQKKGFLNYKSIHVLLFIFSFLFLLGSSFLLYVSYKSYTKKSSEITTTALNKVTIARNFSLTKEEAKIYIDLKNHRNTLTGYINYLRETSDNYDSREYTYANVIKTEIIESLSNKEGTQSYWSEILNNIYSYDTINKDIRRKNYSLTYYLGNDEDYIPEDLEDLTNLEIIREKSIYEYWNKEIINFNRDPEYIERFWKQNKLYIYTFLTKSKYNNYCKKLVDDLITIKNKINEQSNYKEFYEKYNISDPIFYNFPNANFVNSFEHFWAFGFWDRRYEEKNDNIVYNILKEIQLNYQN
ncbi:hypothetical protein [Tenacibaculum ovolyticum]|uniref:hypothetical protein n=1 Tax=Tenacibaculum ovolyticum TaxID=104270 RepID=UPI003BACB783